MGGQDKESVREAVWSRLREEGAARFPFPVEGRIPNFAGAEDAADSLAGQDFYREAGVLKCNPDSPQKPLRLRALQDGKTVFMAVPRLRDRKCFLRLDPDELDEDDYADAVSVSHCSEHGRPISPSEMPHVDLISAGSVAVSPEGERIGKGGGYSDLEFALGREYGLVDEETVVVTTVHELQVVERSWSPADHDVPMDRIFTPARSLECRERRRRPSGVDWSRVDDEMMEAIPPLRALKDG